jgi:phosphopentomutase
MCDYLQAAGYETVGVGKIHDIFAGQGVSRSIRTTGNDDGMKKTLELARGSFSGLAFINLVDFDMVYGHRNDIAGYTSALNAFDVSLGELMRVINEDDLILITADHGCDPSTPSTDHSREYTPMLAFGKALKQGVDLGTRATFADIAATILEIFGIADTLAGKSFLPEIM